MHLLHVREIMDGLINGNVYNITTLNYFNYTYYPGNATISNASACYLALPQFHPTVLQNGTWINGTWCYNPYYGIGSRGSLGIVYACLFAVTVMLTLANLRKHGRLFLPQEKRFRAVGRRWQWYWMLFVAACGMIGGVSAIDVDRDYLQSIALIIQNFFFYLMIPGILAVVWEGVRHWGSWQERQVYDREPFSIPQTGRRERKEFWMPLIFYLFAWLNFFMNIPRNWGGFDSQSSTQQTQTIAIPLATDLRFKAGGFLAFAAWCMICIDLHHAVHHYKPKNRGCFNSFVGFFRFAPKRFLITIPLLLIIIGYTIACSFLWSINPGNQSAHAGWLYGLGYSPALIILCINEISGYLRPNEDRHLLKKRIERGHAVDAEIGYKHVRKPWWWTGVGARFLTPEQRLKNLTTEVGGGRATTRNIERNIELGNMPVRRNDDVNQREDDLEPFKDQGASLSVRPEFRGRSSMISGGSDDSTRPGSERTMSTAASTMRPQHVKSMLDV